MYMKVAWCLRGQPRDVLAGYSTIKGFIDRHPTVQFEFFCHTWFSSEPNHIYSVSSHRNIGRIVQDMSSIANINRLYNPIEHCVQEPIDFDVSDILDLKAVKEILKVPTENILNLKNTRSNLYSQTKVRDILYEYVNRNSIHYDFVISSRYDFYANIPLDLTRCDKTKIYGALNSPGKALIDQFYLMPMHLFFNVCSIYTILDKILDKAEVTNFGVRFCPESLITASLHYFDCMDLLIMTGDIPWFA